jgi:DNA-binding IclR family transcriptional regulator
MKIPNQSMTGTQSLERAIGLLREIATFGKEGARASDLILRCKMEYPTAHRILKSLVEQDVIVKDPETRRYFLGQLIYELGLGVEPRLDMRVHCDAMTTGLAEATGDTIFLNVRSRHDVVCVDRKLGSFPIKTLVFDVGNRRPLGIGAAGIALLMPYSMPEVEEIVRANAIRFARYGRLGAEHIIAMVRRAQEVGYVATDDVVVPGVRALSLPFGGNGYVPPSAISVAAVSARMPRSRIAELLPLMHSTITKLGTADPHTGGTRHAATRTAAIDARPSARAAHGGNRSEARR